MKSHALKTIAAALFVVLASIHTRSHAQDADFNPIYNRMYEKYLETPYPQTAAKLTGLLTPEGRFVTLNYRATDGLPRLHVQYLIVLACAYQHPQSKLYHNKTLKEKYLKALRFWIDTDHRTKNWRLRFISYPKDLSASVVLMNREIKENQELFDISPVTAKSS